MMTLKSTAIFLLMIFAAFLSGCAQRAPLRFLISDDIKTVDWVSQWKVHDKVRFNPRGMVVAGDNLMIYGAFTTPAISVRSFIIFSSDEGKHWREVCRPVYGSKIIAMEFPEPQKGFALIGWVTEGPGELHLARTFDGGVSWEPSVMIPKDNYSGRPTSFSFSDSSKGAIRLEYMDDNPEGLRPVLVTKDGGLSWTPFQEFAGEKPERIEDFPPFTVSFNGFDYKLEKSEEGWKLSRSFSERTMPETVFIFPHEVAISQIVLTETEVEADCGCPGGKIRSRMLK